MRCANIKGSVVEAKYQFYANDEATIRSVEKIKINPEVGKPLKNIRKGTRELYIKPFRLSYEYFKDKNIVYVLDLYHKKKQ